MRTPKKLLAQCKALVGRTCRLAREVHTRGGAVYAVGTRWRVHATWRGRFTIEGVDDAGATELAPNGCIARLVRNVDRGSFDLEPEGPAARV